MASVLTRLAFPTGGLLARYGRWSLRPGRLRFEGLPNLLRPFIGVSWHENTLVGLTMYSFLHDAGSYSAFVPPGLLGVMMRGWLAGYGCVEPAAIPKDGTGNAQAALKHMARAVHGGLNLIIAVDGPHGPPLRVRPGALWLARLTGRPVIPTGVAAWPSLRWPKWDRHVVPLPGARCALVAGEPLWVPRGTDLEPLRELLAERLRHENRRAWDLVSECRRLPAGASPPNGGDEHA